MWILPAQLVVKMGDILVSVELHRGDVLIKLRRVHAKGLKEAGEKPGLVSNHLSPMVLPPRPSEELAEFKGAKVKEVAVCIAPELVLSLWRLTVPSRVVVRAVAQVVAAKNPDTAHALTSRQAQASSQSSI